MKTLALATTAIALAIGSAQAQDLPQASSQWFTDAQATLNEKIARQPITTPAKNVILFVADGMGVGTNYAIRLFAGQQEGKLGEEHVLPHEAFPYLALVKTYNVNAQTPDSAPTAGSMNTGVKQIFNTINLAPEGGVHDDCASEEGNRLTTFAEMMSGEGKSVGVISTARLTHATPAAVYAKTANRNWEGDVPESCTGSKDIATQLFDQMQAGVVDLAMGGGRRYFVPAGTPTDEGGDGRRKDEVNLVQQAKDAGVQYAWNTETFEGLTLDGSTPVLGLFEDSHMAYEADRDPAEEPSLEEMTRAAIQYLANNEDGYYLEIEAGRVDHANHDGNAYRTLTDGVEFAEAIAAADALTNDEDTLIIVTADHEHAIAFNGYCGRGSPILGLCMEIVAGQVEHGEKPELADDGKPYTVIGYLNGPGAVIKKQADDSYAAPEGRAELTQEEATDIDFVQEAMIPMSSESHSGEDVAIYAKGPFAHLFDGTVEQNYIFHVMDYAVKGGAQ
ncbi:alkaline phosphatase [Acuticoccus sp. I52.16.1]|uniref:alkaline phosphatase n=1 Tax=Acuticoccus sp. I52.16.1 TaxID=2928472 RepID=UPI001FD0F916|nr:alkaline phosphatase [Acuticoccus sp. I52.16.1]UOM35902.1 alkaline phosphatase [Acuticoccus sp. I52.16.1]